MSDFNVYTYDTDNRSRPDKPALTPNMAHKVHEQIKMHINIERLLNILKHTITTLV